MREPEKEARVSKLPSDEPDRRVLRRLVEDDGDEFEVQLYEAASDPTNVTIETMRRRYRGMFRRRIRHLEWSASRRRL